MFRLGLWIAACLVLLSAIVVSVLFVRGFFRKPALSPELSVALDGFVWGVTASSTGNLVAWTNGSDTNGTVVSVTSFMARRKGYGT